MMSEKIRLVLENRDKSKAWLGGTAKYEYQQSIQQTQT